MVQSLCSALFSQPGGTTRLTYWGVIGAGETSLYYRMGFITAICLYLYMPSEGKNKRFKRQGIMDRIEGPFWSYFLVSPSYLKNWFEYSLTVFLEIIRYLKGFPSWKLTFDPKQLKIFKDKWLLPKQKYWNIFFLLLISKCVLVQLKLRRGLIESASGFIW